jgi:hypothetical protein
MCGVCYALAVILYQYRQPQHPLRSCTLSRRYGAVHISLMPGVAGKRRLQWQQLHLSHVLEACGLTCLKMCIMFLVCVHVANSAMRLIDLKCEM